MIVITKEEATKRAGMNENEFDEILSSARNKNTIKALC